MDFPSSPKRHLPVISSWSPEALGIPLRVGASAGVPASSTWPAANRALFVPFTLASNYNMARIWWANGATANANIVAGIYTVGGTKLADTGSTAQAGTNVVQSAALALYLTPGAYYMALLFSATTGTIFRTTATTVSIEQTMGMAQQAVGATSLPATASFATVATAFVPLFGLCEASVI